MYSTRFCSMFQIGGDGHVPEPHVAEEGSIRLLDPFAFHDAGKALRRRRHERRQAPPVEVHVLLGPQPDREGGHLLCRQPGGEGEAEE
jgi:hypothetical protein